MARGGDSVVLRDVLDIKEDVYAGDFKVELSQGFTGKAAGRVEEYVVTPQLQEQFGKALKLVRGAVRKNASYAAYLHGSFGAGKSHFLTVLHAVLNGDPSVRTKPRLREIVAEHDDWLRGKRFLMVPYHLVGAANLDEALLGGYVRVVRERYPDAPTPTVFRSDAMLADARGMRERLGDDAFVGLLPADTPGGDDEDGELKVIGAGGSWTSAELDGAFAAPAGDERRERLVSALLTGPMRSYAESAHGDAAKYVPLENGLSAISRHARGLGFDGVVLFLDELVLWLQAHMKERTFVNSEIQKLVKLIESGDADRPVPIVSFISRQRDLSQLVGTDVLGADVKAMEQALEYLNERFEIVDLEDRNLPEIIKERVLKPLPGKEPVLETAFAGIDRSNQQVKDILLDGGGATHADWDGFRAVYPLSPALLNVLVALSGALQRERTGLKLVQQLLQRNADAAVGRLIPLGDLWDVLVDGTGAAFTDRLKRESEAAVKFYGKARTHLLGKYGSDTHADFLADDRFVKTLLLGALAPDVPALRRLTGARLAALNHGSVRSRTVPAGDVVVRRMRDLQATFPSEVRSDGEADPVFSLHLSDLDIEPLLDAVAEEDKAGVRRVWLRDRLWEAIGVRDGQFVAEKEIVWRGTRRVAEFVFGNVRDRSDLPDEQFAPATAGNVRFVVDYPFDDGDHYPSDDFHRVEELKKAGITAPVLVWLTDFFSDQRKAQLGRLMRIGFLLERDRLTDYTGTFPPDDRTKVRRQLEVARDTLTDQLTGALAEVYGLAGRTDANPGPEVPDGRHVLSLQPEYAQPREEGGKGFEANVQHLADGMFSALYPKHPDFGLDGRGQRKAVTAGELRTALEWITRAMDEGGRAKNVDSHHLKTVKRIVEPLELGTVHDGPLVMRRDWRARINQIASAHQQRGDLAVEDIRGWITKDLGHGGLDKLTGNLLIAAYALLDDRAWVYQGGPERQAPALHEIGPGWSLRAQPLPSEEEYGAARDRAARLFGVSAKPAMYARTVNRLAEDVRAKAEAWEKDVAGVRTSLERHATLLGLDTPGEAAPRPAILREAAALLARLTRHGSDATALVRELATASFTASERDLSTAMGSAGEVLRALDDAAWPALTNVRGLIGREDGVGDRARRLFDEIAVAARASEFERSLVPVLAESGEKANAIINAALTVENVFTPRQQPAPGPEDVRIDQPEVATHHPGAPNREVPPPAEPTPAPAGPTSPTATPARTPGTGRRVVASAGTTPLEELLAGELAGVRDDIQTFLAAHPDAAVEISWRPVQAAEEADGADSAEGAGEPR
ncbi:hypothetical protein SAM23877_4564 [Streptomyces ambofaciens ATCC 23877]|uniref:PglY protein n=1 Tax=Streptomyces ambofaciens (strain ATCC 23877 / 3486 / DSM 40053 / JCM 4204 / NBRC 12836 / NRRL B-2516) TaxID=278992 RepID=A0A0K2AX65_STRA7|nr:hypothetical protein [Streptomyces ambofaciens]AKZ57609.1 hypothetical protein SAM23877_4564 [Streptomyces ambofaciens ATCC 23877]